MDIGSVPWTKSGQVEAGSEKEEPMTVKPEHRKALAHSGTGPTKAHAIVMI
jgi:hypothetical protein